MSPARAGKWKKLFKLVTSREGRLGMRAGGNQGYIWVMVHLRYMQIAKKNLALIYRMSLEKRPRLGYSRAVIHTRVVSETVGGNEIICGKGKRKNKKWVQDQL